MMSMRSSPPILAYSVSVWQKSFMTTLGSFPMTRAIDCTTRPTASVSMRNPSIIDWGLLLAMVPLMDAASALSGSGPAYLYMFLDALADGAAACGMPKAKALDYAARTVAGAAQMYLETHRHPGELKDAVCSPGGSTLAGVAALESAGFRSAVMDCVTAAYKRNKELGK